MFAHFEGKASLQVISKPKHFDSSASNFNQVSGEVEDSIDFKFLEDKTATDATSKFASVSKPKVKPTSAIKLEVPRKRDPKFPASSKNTQQKTNTGSTGALPPVNSGSTTTTTSGSTTTAAISGSTAVTTEKPPIGNV